MSAVIRDHHQRAIGELVASIAADDSFQAIILSGSIAKGVARDNSDLDVYLMVPEAEYTQRRARHDLAYNAPCSYPHGYVDGKIISLDVLEVAADRGSEPMRSSFTGSTVVYSTVGDLQPLVDRIAVYPEASRARNMRDFFSQLWLHAGYFGPQAIERDDAFLLSHALTNTVLFAGRLVLAHNRMLFPCPKQLLATVATAPERPDAFLERTNAMLREPSPEAMASYLDLVARFADWGLPEAEALTLFMELDEWSWLDHDPSVAQR